MSRMTSPLLLGIALGLGVGVGLGFLTFAGGGTGNVASLEEFPAAAARSSGPARAAVPPARPPSGLPRDDREEPPAVEVPQEARDRAALLAARTPVPESRGGGGTIHGAVLDAAGQGLAGVTIQADLRPRPAEDAADRGAPRPQPTLDEHLEEALRSYYELAAGHFEAQTDAQGRYVLLGLAQGKYRVEARLEGYGIEAEGDTFAVPAGAELDFTAQRLAEVRASVWLPDGTLASSATIEVTRTLARRSSFRTRESWSAALPVLWIVPGTYQLRATLEDPDAVDESSWSSETVDLTLEEPTEGVQVEFHLRSRAGIVGKVTLADAESSPAPVNVTLMPVGASGEVDRGALAESRQRKTVSPGREEFVFDDLDAGTYAVGVQRGFRDEILASQVVTVTDFRVRCDLELPPLRVEKCLIVRATGPDGHKLQDLGFRVQQQSAGRSSSSSVYASQRKDGDFWLVLTEAMRPLLDPWGPEDHYTLWVDSTGYGTQTVELAEGQRLVALKFGSAAFVTVSIAGYDSSPCAGRLQVGVEDVTTGRPSRTSYGRERISAGGTVRLGPFASGDYRVSLTASNRDFGYSSSAELDSRTTSLGEGENSVSLAVPPVHDLVVSAGEDLQRQRIVLWRADTPRSGRAYQMRANFDARGRATFPCLVAGDYVLEGDGGTMPVSVPAAGEVRFDPRPYTALRVRLTSATGTLAQWGLRDGDVVVAVDGRAFENEQDLEEVLTRVRIQESAVLTVRRNGRALDVPARWPEDPSPDLGGSLELAAE